MLAGVLIDSLDPAPDAEVEATWAKEIGRRVTELDSGSVKTVPWEEVRRDLFDRLNER
jgi:putative addiction module component (TIGR02574 family)